MIITHASLKFFLELIPLILTTWIIASQTQSKNFTKIRLFATPVVLFVIWLVWRDAFYPAWAFNKVEWNSELISGLTIFFNFAIIATASAFTAGSLLLVSEDFDQSTGNIILKKGNPLSLAINFVTSDWGDKKRKNGLNLCRMSWLVIGGLLLGAVLSTGITITLFVFGLGLLLIVGQSPKVIIEKLEDADLSWEWEFFNNTRIPRCPVLWIGILAWIVLLIKFHIPWMITGTLLVAFTLISGIIVGLFVVIPLVTKFGKVETVQPEKPSAIKTTLAYIKGRICPIIKL
jgi:hypothetical protein